MAARKGRKPSGGEQKVARGQLGPAIVAEVDRLVKEEKIAKSEAFRRIAGDTGRSVGTVSVTYYRVTGKKKAAAPGKKRGRPAKVVKAGRARPASQALQELANLILAQERELEQLRSENARLLEIRRLLARA
jgi:hypothetical protein